MSGQDFGQVNFTAWFCLGAISEENSVVGEGFLRV